MADVAVTVAGRAYRLACRDGDEARLQAAAAHLDAQACRLVERLGAVPENRLLLMAGLLVAGELLDARAAAHDGPAAASPADLEEIDGSIERLASRLEAAAAAAPAAPEGLEGSGGCT